MQTSVGAWFYVVREYDAHANQGQLKCNINKVKLGLTLCWGLATPRNFNLDKLGKHSSSLLINKNSYYKLNCRVVS